MLFKNVFIYRLSQPFNLSGSDLDQQLMDNLFVPCSGIKPSSFGWTPIIEGTEALVHEVAGSLLLCARREDKVVPASAVNEALAARVQKLESAEGRKLRAKERQGMKENVMAELLPRALPRAKRVYGYIAPGDDLLVINTSSASEAEMFIDCLRDTLGSFPVTVPQVKSKPTDVFTQWLLTRKLPDGFSLGDQCDLMDPEDRASVSCRRVDLDTSEVRSHVEAGKTCFRIGLRWHGDISFSIDRDLALKQIKVENTANDAPEEEDPIASLDAALAHMSLEFARLFPALFNALGGETRG